MHRSITAIQHEHARHTIPDHTNKVSVKPSAILLPYLWFLEKKKKETLQEAAHGKVYWSNYRHISTFLYVVLYKYTRTLAIIEMPLYLTRHIFVTIQHAEAVSECAKVYGKARQQTLVSRFVIADRRFQWINLLLSRMFFFMC